MNEKIKQAVRAMVEKKGDERLSKALENVLAKGEKKMEDATKNLTKEDLVNDALAKQAEAIKNNKPYDKYAVAKIEAGDKQFIDNYISALNEDKKKS